MWTSFLAEERIFLEEWPGMGHQEDIYVGSTQEHGESELMWTGENTHNGGRAQSGKA